MTYLVDRGAGGFKMEWPECCKREVVSKCDATLIMIRA